MRLYSETITESLRDSQFVKLEEFLRCLVYSYCGFSLSSHRLLYCDIKTEILV